MLTATAATVGGGGGGGVGDGGGGADGGEGSSSAAVSSKEVSRDRSACCKAQLAAVAQEYGEVGIPLPSLRKKFAEVPITAAL